MNSLSSVFRIDRPQKRGRYLQGRESSTDSSGLHDDVLLRVSKLIPAEVVGVYLSGRQIAESNDALGHWAALCLILSFGFRALTTSDSNKPWSVESVQWDAVVYAGISFSIWVYAMGDHIGNLLLTEYGFWASLLAIAWPIVAAKLVTLPRRA